MKHIIIAATMLVISSFAFAADGDDAMLGFKWGMSAQDVRATGANLKKEETDKNLELYEASSVPKPLSEFETYMLTFSDGKLVKILAIGKKISDDPTGSRGKERFETLASAMKEKYGKPTNNYQRIGTMLYKEYDEFYQCLAYSGCGQWASVFEIKDKDVVLKIKGIRRGIGYITITAEATPQWSDALDKHKSKRASSDKDAL